jgi:hypothetical protein
MNRLVLHHVYNHGLAFDTSGSGNHGSRVDVTPGSGTFAGSLQWSAGDSAVLVSPSPSLQNLTAIRTAVRFYAEVPPTGPHRLNLIEGQLSFALVVDDDQALHGTVFDPDRNWVGPRSGPGLVQPRQWHVAQFEHDGVSHCRLLLDGAIVGEQFDARGPVRSVGPRGISIGHWAEEPAVYTFDGYIGEVWLYKYDFAREVNNLLDPCCVQWQVLDEYVKRLRAHGLDDARLEELTYAALGNAASITAAIRGGTSAGTTEQRAASQALIGSLLRGNRPSLDRARDRFLAFAQSRVPAATLQSLGQALLATLDEFGLDPQDWQRLADAICFGWAVGGNQPQSSEQPGQSNHQGG